MALPFFGDRGSGSRSDSDSSNAFIAPGKDGKPYVKDPDALWKEVSDLREDSLSAREPHERMWALCWLFYKGDQWRRPTDNGLIRVNIGKKPKITINKILPMVQTRRAHVLKNRPMGIVMPKTTDEEDRNAARIAQDVLSYDQDHLKNWEILDGKLSLSMFVTGNAFKKVYWDPTRGPVRDANAYTNHPLTGAPVPSAPGEPPPKEASEGGSAESPAPVESAMGDVCIEFVPPEEVLPEPAATSLDDCQRLLHRTLKPLKWVQDTFGAAAEKVEAIDTKTEYGRSIVAGAKLFGLTETEVKSRVEVLEAWYKPNEDFPEGLHAVWADNKLMAAGPTPPAHAHIPFIHYQEIETDEFWGISSVAQTIDPQKALNLAVSRDEYMRQRLRPKLFAATDSGLDENAYTNDDSEIVFVHHPFYPQFSKPPEFKRDAEAVAYFAQAIDDIGGATDIMRGQITGGDVRSGRMVNYLQEYAGTVLASPARQIERGEESTGNMILRLRKHYTTEPRLYYIVGRNKSVEVRQFIGSDIEGCADYSVQAGSALPMSASEKRDLVLSLVEKGVLIPGDPRILKLLGMPSDMEELFDEEQLDRDNATEENHTFLALSDQTIDTAYTAIDNTQQLLIQAAGQMGPQMGPPGMGPEVGAPQPMGPGASPPPGPAMPPGPAAPPQQDPMMGGQPQDPMAALAQMKPSPVQILEFLDIQPRDFENHGVHLEIHNRARKSRAYKQMPLAARALFDEHCDLHAFFLLPPPGAIGDSMGGGPGGGRTPDGNKRDKQDGSPDALSGKPPPGSGGAGNVNAQGNQERKAGLPPTPSPPGANNHHLM